jgi:protein-S-isoprenylcysteine O-methyltransferase Ste14
MTGREFLAALVILLYAARLVEYRLFRRNEPGIHIQARWTTIANLILGLILTAAISAEVLLGTWEPLWQISVAGGVLWIFRLATKIWAVRTLGDAWSTEVRIRPGQRLITRGPYRRIRHPIYLCLMIEPMAVALIANTPNTGVAAILILWPLFLTRLKIEEKSLCENFGEEYRRYARSVPALIPHLRR